MKVLISGAGIAGNALAFWLVKLGHDVTVIERFNGLRTSGLQIDLRGHGIAALRRMGLEDAFRAKSAPENGMAIVDKYGRQRAFFPANTSGEGLQSFTSEFEIMRGDLCRLLHDASLPRAKYVFGTAIESFQQRGQSVDVRFEDGQTDTFDLVVGADGQRSRTRRMMLGPDTPDPFFPIEGYYNGYFTAPRPMKDGEQYVATTFMAPGWRGVMVRRHSPHTIQVYLGCNSDVERLKNARQIGNDEEKAALAEVMQGAGWETDRLLEDLKTADDFYLERMALVRLDAWSQGRVVLVGDAAYCPSAFTGMGSTSAMVGAYVLAGEIATHCGRGGREDTGAGLTTALAAYEQKFRPFMDQVQKHLVEGNGTSLPSSAWAIEGMYWVLGIASWLKLNIMGKWFLKEDVKNWELPAYEEMVDG